MPKNSSRVRKPAEKRLRLQNIGQIKEADIRFGDLTVLVGPQATGKSVLLQLLRLILDRQYIHQQLRSFNLSWEDGKTFLRLFMGEGMEDLWVDLPSGGGSSLTFDGRHYNLKDLAQTRGRPAQIIEPKVCYVPAHRAFALYWDWPVVGPSYTRGDPFVMWDFISQLSVLLTRKLRRGEEEPLSLFSSFYREVLDRDLFLGFQLRVSKSQGSDRLVLQKGGQRPIPFLGWSTGQREVVPLLLALCWLLPSGGATRRESFEWVIVEGPEMGLHPKGISSVLLLVLELLKRGYRVCLSTHSTVVLDLVWALHVIKNNNGDANDCLELFDVHKGQQVREIAKAALEKEYKVYYFEPGQKGIVSVKDISDLDLSSDDYWGGLARFSTRANDVVAKVITRSYAESGVNETADRQLPQESQ